VLANLVNEVLPEGIPLAVRVFGHLEPDACRTDLVVPLQPADPAAVSDLLATIEAKNLARTPIADSLRLVAQDMATAGGTRIVVLVTDGEETCEGDPAQTIQALREQGFDVRVNIVGFAIDDVGLQQQFEEWAKLGGGIYLNATNAAELDQAVQQAVRAPFRVLDANGVVVAGGLVDGSPVILPGGLYTVEVLTDPVRRYEQVELPGAAAVTVTVEGP